ncbi:phage/plasmid replication protein, II/X family [Ventosimonas gracilis]|uniref:phage/plasmid replication protein, II/X family n=1 Tax=Ventosimonas gracilis TaxID=1680762 RepID=UPI0009A24F6B|nr:phage/plasmid replication protein, II/X family [Ventosimonas gracilis]
MLDRLHLFIPFKPEACTAYFWTTEKRKGKVRDVLMSSVDLAYLGVPMQSGSVSLDAKERFIVSELRHAWESLPSSYTPLAFKVFHEGFGFRGEAGVDLKASPAKLTQGHNLFGSTSIRMGALAMKAWLSVAYPDLMAKLNWDEAEVQALDCTYSARLPNERTAQQAIDALRNISNGQTKSRGDNYSETAYWFKKDSRLKGLKAYLKQYEYAHQLIEAQRQAAGSGKKAAAARRTVAVMSDPQLVDWSKCLLRFEATVKSRGLSRRKIPTNLNKLIDYQENLAREGRCLIRELWTETTAPIFKACEGMEMKTIDDEHVQAALKAAYVKTNKHGKPVYTYANNLFNTFRNIRSYGWDETKASIAPSTWTRHTRDLEACGISKAVLQKLPEISKNSVVPLLRFVEIDFSSQRPPWYVEPTAESVLDHCEQFIDSQAANDEHAAPLKKVANVVQIPVCTASPLLPHSPHATAAPPPWALKWLGKPKTHDKTARSSVAI